MLLVQVCEVVEPSVVLDSTVIPGARQVTNEAPRGERVLCYWWPMGQKVKLLSTCRPVDVVVLQLVKRHDGLNISLCGSGTADWSACA